MYATTITKMANNFHYCVFFPKKRKDIRRCKKHMGYFIKNN